MTSVIRERDTTHWPAHVEPSSVESVKKRLLALVAMVALIVSLAGCAIEHGPGMHGGANSRTVPSPAGRL